MCRSHWPTGRKPLDRTGAGFVSGRRCEWMPCRTWATNDSSRPKVAASSAAGRVAAAGFFRRCERSAFAADRATSEFSSACIRSFVCGDSFGNVHGSRSSSYWTKERHPRGVVRVFFIVLTNTQDFYVWWQKLRLIPIRHLRRMVVELAGWRPRAIGEESPDFTGQDARRVSRETRRGGAIRRKVQQKRTAHGGGRWALGVGR